MAQPDEARQSGSGRDQRGFDYEVTYNPEWFRKLAVTRRDSNGQTTTVDVVTNPRTARSAPERPASATTHVKSNEGVDFTLVFRGRAKQVRIDYIVPAESGKDNGDDDEGEVVTLTVDDDQPPPPNEPGGGS